MDHVEVWAERDRWRWAYRDGNGVELLSNQLYDRRAEAEGAAQMAYPDLLLEAPPQPKGNGDRRMLVAIVLLLLAVIGLGIILKRSQPDKDEV